MDGVSILRPERKKNLASYQIIIEEVSGGDIANILRGHIVVNGAKIRFTGIAYGRYGGQNVAPKLSPLARKKLRETFPDLAAFEEDLQIRLVSGDFDMKAKKGSVHSHQHAGESQN
jgi:hypothetical protein